MHMMYTFHAKALVVEEHVDERASPLIILSPKSSKVDEGWKF